LYCRTEIPYLRKDLWIIIIVVYGSPWFNPCVPVEVGRMVKTLTSAGDNSLNPCGWDPIPESIPESIKTNP